jgi:rsbT co-antagonist protein RsbR
MPQHTLAGIIERHESELLNEWIQRQQESLSSRRDLLSEAELRTDSRNLLSALRETPGLSPDLGRSEWARMRDLLGDLSRRRATQGLSPSETATFVLSLKQPVFDRIVQSSGGDPKAMADSLWSATTLLDKLALYTTESYQKTREDLITSQQQEMLSSPRPWWSCGRGCWRCRSSARWTATAPRW